MCHKLRRGSYSRGPCRFSHIFACSGCSEYLEYYVCWTWYGNTDDDLKHVLVGCFGACGSGSKFDAVNCRENRVRITPVGSAPYQICRAGGARSGQDSNQSHCTVFVHRNVDPPRRHITNRGPWQHTTEIKEGSPFIISSCPKKKGLADYHRVAVVD